MTRRLRTDRMHARARGIRTIALLRDSLADIAAKVHSGEWSVGRARVELGLPPTPEALNPNGATER
jgi:hypothetical protein